MQALEDEFRMDMFNLKPVGLSRLSVSGASASARGVVGAAAPVTPRMGAQEMFNTPTLLGVSSAIIPPPLDWAPWTWNCGFWMVNEGGSYVPPPGLEEFLGDVRDPWRRRVLCITFGSMALAGWVVERRCWPSLWCSTR
jgi:hypothetical protein